MTTEERAAILTQNVHRFCIRCGPPKEDRDAAYAAEIADAIRAAVAEERAACAAVCMGLMTAASDNPVVQQYNHGCEDCADAIRERGE